MKVHAFCIGLALAAAAAIPSTANAQSVGDTVTCAVTGSGTFSCSSASATVAAGTEFQIGNAPTYSFLGADFGEGTLFINALADSSLGGTILNFTDTNAPFTSFLLASSSGFAGFDISDVSLTGGLLSIDLRGTNNTQGGQIALQLSSAAAVPEPSTWAMLLLGFGAAGFAMRRRRNTGPRPRLA
jgi:hypothetical protein